MKKIEHQKLKAKMIKMKGLESSKVAMAVAKEVDAKTKEVVAAKELALHQVEEAQKQANELVAKKTIELEKQAAAAQKEVQSKTVDTPAEAVKPQNIQSEIKALKDSIATLV